MEPTFQTTSFIPKKPLAQVKTQKDKSINLFTLGAVLLLLLTLLFTGGLYVWNKSLKTQIEDLKKTIEQAQEKFDPVTLQNLKKLDKQISTATTLLNDHVTLSPILVNVLNANTLRKVQYTQFSHVVTGGGKAAKIQVKLTGKADSLPYVALQSKKLAENRYVQNPLFSDIVTAKDNTVTFNLIFDLSPTLIVYSQLINGFNNTAPNTESILINNTNQSAS